MCFSPQRRAIFDLAADHLTPHPPLEQAYFSTDPTHESLKKHSISWLLEHLSRMYLLSLDFDTIASFVDWLDDSTAELCICFSTLHIVGSFYLNFLR